MQGTMSPEQYRKSQERLMILSEMIKDGQKAEIVLDFANAILEEVKEEVLLKLKAPNSNLEEIQGFYKGACLFVDKINDIAALGKSKRKKLEEINKKKTEE